MVVTFDAFGVRFDVTFPLPEIHGGRSHAPVECTVRLVGPDEPRRRFSGPCDPVRVATATLGDGLESRVERGRGGDHLLLFGSAPTLWLSAPGDELACGPEELESPEWRRYLLDTGLGFVALAHGHQGLHAGAVATPAGVVAVSAGQGGGKSTLLAELLRRGLPLFTDDLLMLTPVGDGEVEAHPGPALMNLPPQLADGRSASAVGQVLADIGDEAWVAVERPALEPAPVAAVVLLERGRADRVNVELLPASPMTLLPQSLPSGADRDRVRARFEACAALAASARLLVLAAPLEAPAAALADALLGDIGVAT